MENLFQSVVALQDRLREAGILSAVIGGVAVGVWGEPRVTRDVDVKVLLGRDAAPRLLQVIGPDYVPLQADPLAALTRTGVLFVQDAQGTRLDLLLGEKAPLCATNTQGSLSCCSPWLSGSWGSVWGG